MSKPYDFRERAKALRKAGDILDKVADNLDDKTLTGKEKEEKQDALLAEFMVQMLKIQAL